MVNRLIKIDYLKTYLMTTQIARAVIGKAAPFFKANSWVSSLNEFK